MNSPTQAASPWSSERRIAAMRRWHDFWNAAVRGTTKLFLDALPQRPGLRVLDLASGSGEPAISLAAAIGPQGQVVATDISADILGVAEESARRAGCTTIRYQVCVAELLPFPESSFDALTCRFGVMFFTDAQKALRETRRVLRPGGPAIFLAWELAEQPYFAATIELVRKYAGLTEPREALDIYRFGQTGKLSAEFREAGFARVSEEIHTIQLAWPGPPEQVWEYFRETSAQHGPLFDSLPPAVRAQAAAEAKAALTKYARGQSVVVPASVILAQGIVE